MVPVGQWISLEQVDERWRVYLTGEVTAPQGRYVPWSPNLVTDMRFWAGFVGVWAGFTALMSLVIFPVTVGGGPEWGLGLGAGAIAAVAWVLRKKLPGPKIPAGKGTYFLEDALVVFDGSLALIVPRHEITGMLNYRHSNWLVLRGDLPRVLIPRDFIEGYDFDGEALRLPFDEWCKTGEPLSAPRRPKLTIVDGEIIES
jgi:hypothetical protein